MKVLEKFELIDKARKNRENRENPWEFFHRKFDLLIALSDAENEHIKRKDLLLESRKHHINGLVTSMEVFLKEVFRILVDEKQVKCDDLLKKNISYSLFSVIPHSLLWG